MGPMLREWAAGVDKSYWISGGAHTVLILWILLGDVLFSPRETPEPETMAVSTISSEDFAALMAASGGSTEAPVTPATAAPATAAPAASMRPQSRPEPVAEPVPEPAPQPEPVVEATPEPEPEPAPEPIPEAVVAQPEPVPQPLAPPSDAPQPVPVPASSALPRPRPSRRVAETPQDAPPEDMPDAPEVQQAVSDQAAPEAPVVEQEQTPAAPEEATTEIVTEATETAEAPQLAPTSSPRPQSRPRPAQPAETQQATAPTTRQSASSANVGRASDREATDAALAEALGMTEPAEPAAPAAAPSGGAGNTNAAPGQGIAANGPPMSAGEKDALRAAIQRCWNVGSLSTEAQRVTVTVRVSLGADRKPIGSTVELVASNGDSGPTRQAYEAARRAILRCGQTGFPLPDAKYETWKDLRLVFDSQGIGL